MLTPAPIENISPLPEEIAALPQFAPTSKTNFQWGDVDGDAFVHSIDHSYDKIVHWIHNLPSGKAGKAFIQELTRMF